MSGAGGFLKSRAHFEQLLRPLGVEAELFLARPLQTYWLTHGAGKQKSFHRGIVIAVAAVGAGAISEDDADAGGIDGELARQSLANAVCALRRTPDGHCAVGFDV